jgi:uncharacterized protein YbbK (DUF523 family)
MREKILVSACLLGINCKWDGTSSKKVHLAVVEKFTMELFQGN